MRTLPSPSRCREIGSSGSSPLTFALALGALLPAYAGCGAPPESGAGGIEISTGEIEDVNGLKAINGFKVSNGLESVSGLNLSSGLSSSTGLTGSSSFVATADGRTTLAYLVRCALPAGRTLSKTTAGITYSFRGEVGLAPEWETGACGQMCQQWVSACMLALVNTTGQHISLWTVGQHKALGWGEDAGYSYQEGSFFGNIFTSPPSAYFCGGRDYGVHPIAGRIGSTQTDPPYTNIYGAGGRCGPTCTPADIPYASDGVKACSGWNAVVTVWHQ